MPRSTRSKRKEPDARIGAKRKTNSKISRLLRLPAELRMTIYSYVLTQPDAMSVTGNDVGRTTQLLRVCHQIRIEAMHIFYSSNSFVITDIETSFTREFLAHSSSLMLRRVSLFKIFLQIPKEKQARAKKYYQHIRSSSAREVLQAELLSHMNTFGPLVMDLAGTLRSYGVPANRICITQDWLRFAGGFGATMRIAVDRWFALATQNFPCVTIGDIGFWEARNYGNVVEWSERQTGVLAWRRIIRSGQ